MNNTDNCFPYCGHLLKDGKVLMYKNDDINNFRIVDKEVANRLYNYWKFKNNKQ